MKNNWDAKTWEALIKALEKIKGGKITDFECGVVAGVAAMLSKKDKSA